ncbi:ABC-F family ATP-binding cassette domain-containing protein [Solitalea koreensis]|uniref:Probable ATP-binding protein YbiT n=1 Tax=Solitalea koreensis TaxID=543615 RepID=A0A521D702_9SPHI|nr:ABC-F family ATP-binding cassette domain-containing protein [Solitalea koreensis]SMO67375.1 ATP-binding cassette, subfamily F, member 3 [Solitalea koreensis]
MIAINDLTFEIGARALYDEASWHIKPGEHIGLIGANGTGKTTLLKLIVGDERPTSGVISKSKDIKIGYLNQDLLSIHSDFSILHVAMEAFERQNQLHDEIEEILQKMETDYSESLLHKLSDKQQEFENLDGYNIQYHAEQILAGLGFNPEDTKRPLKEFSGGWRMRVMLAKILLQKPDLLLLDEPTNHLDLPSIKWLEDYLNAFDGAYIIVSHDRYFLDRTVTRIVESRGGQLTVYAGNYTFYLEEKAMRDEIQGNQFKNQQQKIKQEEKLIDRFRAKASKAKMVQSRIKALDRMEKVEDVDSDVASVSFKFKCSRPSGRHVVMMKDISKSYPGLDILKKASADIEKGDKIALIGANGKGKSTLLRLVAGTDKCEGEITVGHNVSQTFFAQHQLESLHLENTILAEMQAFAPTHTDTELRGILGCFLFTGDDVFKKIKVLSGGEKSRVALAKALTSDANFLVLDEPTNHLDMQSVNILIQALQQYEGTVILVSHDRYLVDNVANKIWFIEDHDIKQYPGSYREFDEWYEKRIKDKERDAKTGKKVEPKVEKKEGKVAQIDVKPEKSKELKKMNRELEQLEQQLADLETEKKRIEAEIGKEEVFSNPTKLNEANKSYTEVKKDLEDVQLQWDQLADKIMEMES